ncbi:hypothetical protein BCR44DRAFT_1010610 [Catenaria anguillulae PL171]|uniref:Uncharacterized protein n=1 Tax=Catenaria anguillulae PL171 TaxID=765915 RepID=A0A1Y2I6F7_9FUNG|nr:hypothetical protein BCR44DRAFT_1010610 [Catenaria anguillulae PL171]
MRPLSLVSLLGLFAAHHGHGAWAMPAPAPQVTLTATIPAGPINPTLTITVSTPPITTPTTTSTSTTAQDGAGSAVTTSTSPSTSQATVISTPWILVLPGYGNVTRQGDGQSSTSTSTTTTTTTATTTSTTEAASGSAVTTASTSEIPLVGTVTQTTQTVTISVSDIPVMTATVTLPQSIAPTPTPPPVRARKLRRRQTPGQTTTTTASTATTQQGGGQASATSAPGDSIFAYGQAFLFEPPTQAQATDPYFGPFAAFRAENLTLEEEQRLVNRSYYFKGKPYSGQAQVQLAANQSTPASDAAVFDIPSPSPLVPKQLAWQSPDHPQPSRKSLPVSPQNGVLIINSSWTGLPGGLISVQPVQGLLGSVLLPYQVAPLAQNQLPVPSPVVAGVSHLVLAPQNTRERQAQVQQGGQQPQPQPGQDGGVQGGFVPRQIEALRRQAVIEKHIAVISDIDVRPVSLTFLSRGLKPSLTLSTTGFRM